MKKRTNDEWLASLRGGGPSREQALVDLGEVIQAGLPHALSKWLSSDDPRFGPLAEEVTQETILRVLARLDSFEGRSQFTTWVYTIAVRVALTELRRARWKEVSLEDVLQPKDDDGEAQELSAGNPGVESVIERKEMMKTLRKVMEKELTEKQRMALMAVTLGEMPLEEVARRMGTERNTLYKLLHDARLKLKRQLEKSGLSTAELLASFD